MTKNDTHRDTATHNKGARATIRQRASYLAGLAASLLTLSACSTDRVFGIETRTILNFGDRNGVTDEAHAMRNFWTWSVLAALFIGSCVWLLTAVILVRYRRKKTDTDFPPQVGYNVPLETSYTILPVVIVLILFWGTIHVQNKVDAIKPNPPVVIDVTAFKWNWKFGYNTVNIGDYQYAGAHDPQHPDVHDPYHGQSAYEIEKAREHELTEAQAHGNEVSLKQLKLDEVETIGSTTEVPVLVLPVNSRVEFRLASADVIHSFYVPEFLFKRDVMPYPIAEHSEFQFQISGIERTGSFVGRCAEMCGQFHSAMNFEVRAVSIPDFETYLNARRQGSTNAEALAAIHTSPVATATKPFDRG